MARMGRFRMATAALAGLAATGILCASAQADEFVSHRGVYRHYLPSAQTAAGRSTEEYRRDCRNWISKVRFRLRGRRQLPLDGDFEGRETVDGRRFQFAHRSSLDEGPFRAIRGFAVRGAGKSPGFVVYTEPARRRLALPRGTMFLDGFFVQALRALRRSPQTRVRRTPVFGMLSSSLRLYYVDMRVSKRELPLFSRIEGDAHLVDAPSMVIEMRWFIGPRARRPYASMLARVHSNGIYSRAVTVKDGKTIETELAEIRALRTDPC